MTENIYFMEVGSKHDLGRKAILFKRKQVPVKRVLFAAHGDSEGIRLGRSQDFDVTEMEASVSLGRLVEKGIIQPDCDVYFMSCSAGAEGAAAEVISHKNNIGSVVGPIAPASSRFDGGEITYTTYTDNSTRIPVETATYARGKRHHLTSAL